METIERLTELLEAARAGVEALSRLMEEATTPETRKLFEGARDAEARSCAGLAGAIERLGGARRTFLGEMRVVHARNIDRCEGLLAQLDARGARGEGETGSRGPDSRRAASHDAGHRS
jgi:hypothetical protein